ncbi:tetratricopeptide repeat protein [Arthrobacter sp. Bi26]|uniref:tetratricopeptide repeat protein n=1 Tax=Arthrobacter sp. Bi26 TaxID=2822350 RepID=UPI001E3CDF83|nr:tetratricopeptide repeat protein [Arthrobacter sp. Bi26]
MLVPGIIGLLIAATMDKTSALALWLTFAFGALALVVPAWMNIYVPLRDKRKSSLEARDDVLEPLKFDPPDMTASLKWLLPRWSRSSVHGSRNTYKKLDAWLHSSTPIMIIDGGPLVGKTRMAIEWADSLGPEWETGWLRNDKTAEALKRIRAYGKNTVIVVDGVPPHFSELVHDLSQHKSLPQIRVLLTVRNAQGLRIENQYAAAAIEEVKPLHLGPAGDSGDRERWFEDLCTHYADRLSVPVPPKHPEFIRKLGAVPIGVLHAAALVAARTGAVPFRNRSIQELMYELWKTEVDSWRNAPGTGRDGVGDAQIERLEHAVITLSLLVPVDLQMAVELLGKIPTLSGTDTGTRKDIAAWAVRMYPATGEDQPGVVEFSPRIIVVAAFLHIAGNDRTFREALLGSLTNENAHAVLARLVEASPLLPAAAALATDIIGRDYQRLTAALALGLSAASSNSALDRELARCTSTADLNEDQTIKLHGRTLEGPFPMTQVALEELLVKQLRLQANKNAGKYEPDVAAALNDLVAGLAHLGGRDADALRAAEESVTTYRQLAADNPVLYEPELASALGNLANCIAVAGGRTADALSTGQESAALYWGLAADNPETYEPGLALALHNLANRLAEAGGRNADALDAAQQSLAIYQRLAGDNPETYEPGLALALNNLANRLAQAGGRNAEALDAAQQSLAIYRRLAGDNPVKYEPRLARALYNLAGRLAHGGGRDADALEAAEKSVIIYRQLAADNAALYEPEFAEALSMLAGRLVKGGGRVAEALKAAGESVTIFRRLAAAKPALYEPELAKALNNMVGQLGTAGGAHGAETLGAAKESVTIYRRLAAADPLLCEPGLAKALGNLASRLAQTGGRASEALKTAGESVTIFRRLAAANPTLYEPDLAAALNTLASQFAQARMDENALIASKELIQIYERLAQQDSRFKAPLNRVQRMISEWSQMP